MRLHQKWQRGREEREALTGPLLTELQNMRMDQVSQDPCAILDLAAAVQDWTAIGIAAGLRLSECGQSKKKKGELFATTPNTPAAGQWAGSSLAFIKSDFTFLTEDRLVIPTPTGDPRDILRTAECGRTRFRAQKNGQNDVEKEWARNAGHFLDVVRAMVSILCRHWMLHLPDSCPLGVYHDADQKSFEFLKGPDITSMLRLACVRACPDERHCLRQRIDCIVTHSNRVAACLMLKQAGFTEEQIANKLRWNVESVKFYLRECHLTVDEFTKRAFHAALTL